MTTSNGTTRLVPGPGTALVGQTSFALMAAAPAALIDELWPLIDGGSDIDALLEAVSAEGLRTLGAFALARVEPGGVRILVRGDASARLSTPSGGHTFDARSVRTWAEHFVDDATAFELRLGAAASGAAQYHLDRGVVPAAAIVWPYQPTGDGIDNASLSGLVDVAENVPVAAPVAAPPAISVDDPDDADDQPESSDELAAGEAQAVDGNVEPASGETVHLSRFNDDAGDLSVADGEPDGELVTEPVAAGDDYDALYGHTIHRSVQQAAVEPEPEPEAPADHPPVTAASDSPELQSTPSDAVADPPVPGPASAPIISGVPISGVPGGAPSAIADEGDHDGLTISAAQLRAMRAGAGATPPAPVAAMGGPTVQAVVCRSGHPNPPQRTTCRVCASALDGAPQIVPRPSMGRITMSTGDVIDLVRPAVVGRNPKVEGRLPSEVPQMLKLDVGQALSRSHAMIRLEGWQVLVEDLGSANGTVVTLPGRPPQRLHAGEPVLIESGAVIDLGGEVTGTYDAGA